MLYKSENWSIYLQYLFPFVNFVPLTSFGIIKYSILFDIKLAWDKKKIMT